MSGASQIELFNDLVKINNDRIQGYTKAIETIRDEHTDLKALFSYMIHQSQQNNVVLSTEIKKLGGSPKNSTTISGKIYRTLMTIRGSFTGTSRSAILGSCEFGEIAAKRAYEMAIENSDIDSIQRQVLRNQYAIQSLSYGKIRSWKVCERVA